MLDIVISPDLARWEWKDEDEIARALENGIISTDDVRRIRAEGTKVIERARLRRSPFRDGWEQWKPDPS